MRQRWPKSNKQAATPIAEPVPFRHWPITSIPTQPALVTHALAAQPARTPIQCILCEELHSWWECYKLKLLRAAARGIPNNRNAPQCGPAVARRLPRQPQHGWHTSSPQSAVIKEKTRPGSQQGSTRKAERVTHMTIHSDTDRAFRCRQCVQMQTVCSDA